MLITNGFLFCLEPRALNLIVLYPGAHKESPIHITISKRAPPSVGTPAILKLPQRATYVVGRVSKCHEKVPEPCEAFN